MICDTLFGGTKVLGHTADKVDTSSELAVCAQFRCLHV
jgi:hypothetical protein